MTSAEVEALPGPPLEKFIYSRDGEKVNWMCKYPKTSIDFDFLEKTAPGQERQGHQGHQWLLYLITCRYVLMLS
jgi:hypothetical protein